MPIKNKGVFKTFTITCLYRGGVSYDTYSSMFISHFKDGFTPDFILYYKKIYPGTMNSSRVLVTCAYSPSPRTDLPGSLLHM